MTPTERAEQILELSSEIKATQERLKEIKNTVDKVLSACRHFHHFDLLEEIITLGIKEREIRTEKELNELFNKMASLANTNSNTTLRVSPVYGN